MKMILKKSVGFLAAAGFSVSLATGCATGKTHDHSSHSSTSGARPYPLQTCLVTDEKLGSHDEATVFVHQGQEIKLCCEGCKEDFDQDPGTYLKKLQAAK